MVQISGHKTDALRIGLVSDVLIILASSLHQSYAVTSAGDIPLSSQNIIESVNQSHTKILP